MSGSAVAGWLHRHDPQHYALNRSYRCAIVSTAALAIGELIGNSQLTTFASFGALAMLLFADFPGDRSARIGGYVGLAVVGLVLIPLGTVLAEPWWIAAISMVAVGFVVLFAGVLSAAIAAGGRAALLAYILPVTLTGGLADVPSRMVGWLLAFALALPAALFLWPPRDHDALRSRTADACAALADRLNGLDGAGDDPGSEALPTAVRALRTQFRGTVSRPMSLTSGGRLLARAPDQIEWLAATTAQLTPAAVAGWSPQVRPLLPACVSVLRACVALLGSGQRARATADREALAAALTRLHDERVRLSEAVVDEMIAGSPDPRGIPRQMHEIAYATVLLGRTVTAAADADARPLADRLLGRHTSGSVDSPIVVARRVAVGHLTLRSVWFRNSLRGALGLGLAVGAADFLEVQHAFWVGLGALSVLRTSALNTGASALRALGGTVIGFALGAALMWATGVNLAALWVLWPFAVFGAAFAPSVIGFAAGQAAFTVAVIVLFNIIVPTGWTVGLVRIEDIALGCGAGLVVGLLFWPRGATAQITSALAVAYRRSAEACRAAVAFVVDGAGDPGAMDAALGKGRAAAARLDDAYRQYLAERGSKPVPLHELTAASNGASRLRLTTEAIAALARKSSPAAAATAQASSRPVQLVATITGDHAARNRAWFDAAADMLERAPVVQAQLPQPTAADACAKVVEVITSDPEPLRNAANAGRAGALWTTCLYLDDISSIQDRISQPVTVLSSPDLWRRAAAPQPAPTAG